MHKKIFKCSFFVFVCLLVKTSYLLTPFEVDKRPAVAYNADTHTCSSGLIVFFSCHPTALCYAVHGNQSRHFVTMVQWSRHMHNSLSLDIMPPRIDAPRSAYLLHTIARYTVLAVGKHEDHCLRRPITKAIYPGPWGRHESNP